MAILATVCRVLTTRVETRNHTESNQLAPRYIEGKLLGYVVGTHNYIILDERGRITQSRDVIFDKDPPIPTTVDKGENTILETPPVEIKIELEDSSIKKEDSKDVIKIQEQPIEPRPKRQRMIPYVKIPTRNRYQVLEPEEAD
jgi:hypothetical protein